MEIHTWLQKKSERERDYTDSRFRGQPICLKTFLFLHTIGKKRYRTWSNTTVSMGCHPVAMEIYTGSLGMLPLLVKKRGLLCS